VFENWVLSRKFGPKRDDVAGEWRKLHIEELHELYSSPHIIKQIKSSRMRRAGHVSRMGEDRKVYRVVVGRPERKRPLLRRRYKWEDGMRMDLGEIGWGGDWIQLAQGKGRWWVLVNTVMNIQVLVAWS
jgi:hypothetical protein